VIGEVDRAKQRSLSVVSVPVLELAPSVDQAINKFHLAAGSECKGGCATTPQLLHVKK